MDRLNICSFSYHLSSICFFSNFLVALSSICLFTNLSTLLGLEYAASSTQQNCAVELSDESLTLFVLQSYENRWLGLRKV